MVHLFFQRVANNPNLADLYAARTPVKLKFSSVFPILFPKHGTFEESVASWLDAISDQFRFYSYESKVSKFIVSEVATMFYELKIHPENVKNIPVFQFWVFLVWTYWKLVREDYMRNDNIFGFMRGFPINQTFVVILGYDPAKNCPSSGYAFHESPCPSTWALLEFMHHEMGIICDHFKNLAWRLTRSELDGAKRNCNMQGWISQGVLLLNSVLTYFENGPIAESWQVFTDFVLSYLSNNLTNVVFILLGGNAAGKKHLINKRNHHVMELYHPGFYSFPPMQPLQRRLDWNFMLPFINANFFLYQTFGEVALVDWVSIGWYKRGKQYRVKSFKLFFDFVIKCYHAGSGGWGQVRNGLKVSLDANGRLVLVADLSSPPYLPS
ncbi:Uracil-DNA glycosylase [Orchesella cincta]|uniref:Uracil-DNA glycosylase n=1 Tax=Orchesella cincta TaxID=48709 RepID=A0A1D2MTF8_ORCCI|nr:Uracil-DNA glycosylase [Orchesella cincta]